MDLLPDRLSLPLEGEDPFAGIRMALAATRDGDAHDLGGLGDLDEIPLGPRTSYDLARGTSTLLAYRHWAERAGSQQLAFEGDPEWSPERRFERGFERLALPGLGRMGRYDLLVTLGWLGCYEMRADSLHLTSASDANSGDLTTLAAKRVFAIGDPLLLERRARASPERSRCRSKRSTWRWRTGARGRGGCSASIAVQRSARARTLPRGI